MKKIAVVLLMILLVFTFSSCGNAGGAHQQYNTAMDLWASGQRYDAVKLLTKNPTYKDSWNYIKEFYQAVGEKVRVSVGRTVGLRADGTVLDTKSNYAVSKWSGIVQIASGISVVAGLTDSERVAFIQEDVWTNEVASSGYISGWTNIKSITSDGIGIVGITESGSVLMEGRNDLSSFDLSQLSGAVSIEDSGDFLAGLLPGGTVAITGHTFGIDFSDVSDWTDIIEISAKGSDIIGLKADGTAIAGPNYPGEAAAKVSEWTNIVSVCALGQDVFAGLKSDGTIVITTDKWDLSDWSNVVTIAGNSEHIVALRSDGTVLAAGYYPSDVLDAAAEWTDIVALADTSDHLVGLKSDGTVVAAGGNNYGQCNLSTWKLFNNVNEIFIPYFQFDDQAQDESSTAEYDSLMSNFEYRVGNSGNAEITGYITNAEMLKIPSEIDGHPVTALSDYCFARRTALVSADIPESVKTIGIQAFSGCENLTTITIPDSVTCIGASAFEGCSNLILADIPKGLKEIGQSAFSGCSKLSAATIPMGVEVIEPWTFRDCSSLSSVVIPDSVTYLSDSAFESCINLSSITIPESVDHIGSWTFSRCTSLTDVVIPDNLSGIGNGAFSGCSSLTYITIPAGITYIGDGAFRQCTDLTDVYLPAACSNWIGTGVFTGCTNLRNLYIGTPQVYFDLYTHGAFEGCPYFTVICDGIKYAWEGEYIIRDSNGNELNYDSEQNMIEGKTDDNNIFIEPTSPGNETNVKQENSDFSELNISVGDTISFGKYNWKVLDIEDGVALIITDYIIDEMPYNDALEEITWENCSLRKYLNNEFYNCFSRSDKERIMEVINLNHGNSQYEISGGNSTADNIFLLSIEEANKYDITIPEYVLLDTVWWLRSPGDEKTGAAGVYGGGIINTEGYYVNEYGGVRPALWLSLDSQ